MILACMLSVGCETESQRLASMADRTVEMQSEQNSIIAKTTSGIDCRVRIQQSKSVARPGARIYLVVLDFSDCKFEQSFHRFVSTPCFVSPSCSKIDKENLGDPQT